MLDSEVKSLVLSGYCKVSNRHKIISRIDSENWLRILAKHLCPWDPEVEGLRRASMPRMSDYYRRCLSKDTLEIKDVTAFKKFPASDSGPEYYLAKRE